MCLPKAPKVPAPVAATPQVNDEEIQDEANKERRRRLGAQGRSSTILTGGLGTTGSTSTQKTLLGQ